MGVREAVEKQLEAKLDAWEKEIAEIKAKAEAQKSRAEADEADARTQEEIYAKIDALRKAVEDGRKKLRKLKQAGDDAWEDLRGGLDKSWKDLGKTVDSVLSNFRS
jgi:predicted RNase H-like nuclease (RuvC/YqgF family)